MYASVRAQSPAGGGVSSSALPVLEALALPDQPPGRTDTRPWVRNEEPVCTGPPAPTRPVGHSDSLDGMDCCSRRRTPKWQPPRISHRVEVTANNSVPGMTQAQAPPRSPILSVPGATD